MRLMVFLRNAYAIVGPFLLLAAIVLTLARARRRPLALRILMAALCLVVVLLRVNGLALYGYFRGIVWEFSLTSLILLGCVVICQIFNRVVLPSADLSTILYAVAGAGAFFYISAFSLLPVDIYRVGYQPLILLVILLALSIGAWFSGRRVAALVPLIAVAAYDLHLLDSYNLWDYLIDPLVTIFAWGWLVWRIIVKSRPDPFGRTQDYIERKPLQ